MELMPAPSSKIPQKKLRTKCSSALKNKERLPVMAGRAPESSKSPIITEKKTRKPQTNRQVTEAFLTLSVKAAEKPFCSATYIGAGLLPVLIFKSIPVNTADMICIP